ncbi:MAG: helix-turn-helix transcriptional regulator [Balneolaceae bacterium]|nr:helix-turn-helix transcriptional regulator [Balneolaceae bacterium]
MKKEHDIEQYRTRNFHPSGLLHEEGISLAQLIENERNSILPSPYFFVFYDYQLSETLYVSSSVEHLYGINKHVIYGGEEHLLVEIILRDEQPAVKSFVTEVWDDHYHRGEIYLTDRVFTVEYRVQRSNGDILHIMHQNEVLSFTKKNLPKITIARFLDMSWLFGDEKERIVKFYMYNRQTNKIEYFAEKLVFKHAPPRLTSREDQVQHLINHGFTSNQIAGKLDISVETVKTHRKNIKAKKADA